MTIRGRYSPVSVKVLKGTAVGQLLFWDGTKWVPTETSELFWDDTNKRLGINDSAPSARLDAGGTVRMTRLLAGGVK